MTGESRVPVAVVVAFATLTMLFFSAALLANLYRYEVAGRAESVSVSALPSILHLTAASNDLRDMEVAIEGYFELTDVERSAALATMREKWSGMDAELTAYVTLPPYHGERELFATKVPPALREVGSLLSRIEGEGRESALERAATDRDLRTATHHAARLLGDLVTLNADEAQHDVAAVAATEQRSALRSLLLHIIAALFAVPLAWLVVREFRAHDRLRLAHSATVERRAAELEGIGERIAQELVNPLSAIASAIEPLEPATKGDPQMQAACKRVHGCLARAQLTVQGVFDFARSGGAPEPNAHADVRQFLDAVIADVLSTETERPEVRVVPFESCAVACPPGVLTCVLTNLVSNAVKFMRRSDVKEITVRVRDMDSTVRVQIEDSGPGIPRSLEKRIFEPYIRDEGGALPGLGLGLATVKRYCEAYGGSVGVRTVPGRGAAFWFTLPKAGNGAAATPPMDAEASTLGSFPLM